MSVRPLLTIQKSFPVDIQLNWSVKPLGTWYDFENDFCVKIIRASKNWSFVQNPLPKGAEKRFHFSDFTITLNEEEELVAPTDSRHRKDQRLMEETKWDEANAEKQV